jgi:hypothetical protein
LKRTTAKILVPAPNIDKPISFSANLPLKIHIEANFEFVDNINTIAVMVSGIIMIQTKPHRQN